MYCKALIFRCIVFGQDDAKVSRLLEKIAHIYLTVSIEAKEEIVLVMTRKLRCSTVAFYWIMMMKTILILEKMNYSKE